MDLGDLTVLAAVCFIAGGISLMFGVGVGLISLGLLLITIIMIVGKVRDANK